jgi:Fic family protein
MNKEINTFHTGRYLFKYDTDADLCMLNNAQDIFCHMPLMPETERALQDISIEESVFYESTMEESNVTFDQVRMITGHSRSNFTQDTQAIRTINICIALKKIKSSTDTALTPEFISDIHKELINALPGMKEENGTYRKGGAKADEKLISVDYIPPASTIDINLLIKSLIEWIQSDLADANPVYRAILLHLHLKKIQPYTDSNGHTARIIEQWFLHKHKIKFLAGMLARIYHKNRDEYYRCISDFYATSDAGSFVRFVSEKLKDDLNRIRMTNYKAISALVSAQSLTFLLNNKTLLKRQFDFLRFIRDENICFTPEDLQVRKEFVKYYGGVSRTTVSRDVKKFESLGLIEKCEDCYRFKTV